MWKLRCIVIAFSVLFLLPTVCFADDRAANTWLDDLLTVPYAPIDKVAPPRRPILELGTCPCTIGAHS